MHVRKITGLLLLTVVIALSCGKDDNNPPQANLRFAHMSPNAPSLDYVINNELFIGNNAYSSATVYRPTNAGAVTVNVRQSGTTTNLFNISGTLSQDRFYSVFMFDSVANLKVSLMEDDRTPPPAGRVNIRFLHLVPGQGPVDIIRAGGPVRLFTNRSFNDHSTDVNQTRYTAVDPGPFSVSAIVAGSVNTLVVQLPSFQATAGKSYTLVLRGFRGAVFPSPNVISLAPIEDN